MENLAFRHKSNSGEAKADMEAADLRRERGPGFKGVRSALEWYFEARERMQSPNNNSPKSETALDGSQAIVRVDGGKGGNIDDTLSTISTIGGALGALNKFDNQLHYIVVACHRDGKRLADLEEKMGIAISTISARLGKGESFLAGRLHGTGVLR